MWYVLLCVVSLGWAQTPLDKDDHLSWLLFQDPPGSSGLVVRRITPKSVFVAPSFCPEGTRLDANNLCRKHVRVDPSLQQEFLLAALNAMFSPAEPQKGPPEKKGPLTFSIPIAPDEKTTTTPSIETTTQTTEAPTTTTKPRPTTTIPPPASSTTEESTTTTFPTTSTTQVDETTTEDIISSSTETGTTEMSTLPSTTEEIFSTTTDSDQSTTDLEPSTTELSTSTSPSPTTETIDIKLGVKKLKCGVGIQVLQASDADFTPLDCVEEESDPSTYPPPPPPPPPTLPPSVVPFNTIRFPGNSQNVRFPPERQRPSSFETNQAYYVPSRKSFYNFFPSFWPLSWSRNRN